MGRRSLNHLVGQMRREDRQRAHVHVITGLDTPCAGCGHELGYHRFVTFTLPTPCQVDGCRCGNFQQEPPMLNPHDPFAGLAEPPSPFAGMDEPEPPTSDVAPMIPLRNMATTVVPGSVTTHPFGVDHFAALSSPVGVSIDDEASTPVRFPVLAAGVTSIPFADLVGPAQRVAEIIEALEPVLAPPAVVEQLQALVAKADALVVNDAASYKAGCDLYELLAANEKGIEEGEIGNVVRFFYRPWKAFCDFRARHLKPVTEAKKRLSDVCGTWKLEQDKRDAVAAQELADAAAADERKRLADLAAAATAAAVAAPEASPVREVLEQAAAQATEQAQHVMSIVPPRQAGGGGGAAGNGKTKGRKTYEAVIVDADAFYKALVDDSTRRLAAPIDQAYLNKQACDLQGDIAKRFPGVEAREKGGLTAGGRRP